MARVNNAESRSRGEIWYSLFLSHGIKVPSFSSLRNSSVWLQKYYNGKYCKWTVTLNVIAGILARRNEEVRHTLFHLIVHMCGRRHGSRVHLSAKMHFSGEFPDRAYLKISSAASPYQERITRERDCLLVANVRDATCTDIRWNIYDITLHFTRPPSGKHRVDFQAKYIFISSRWFVS